MYNQFDLENLSDDFYFLFYDIESSQAYFLGQILSISFCLTNRHLEPIALFPLKTFNGKLSVLELPHPLAIATNNIDVFKSQEEGFPENILAKKIFDYINQIIQKLSVNRIYFTAHNGRFFDLVFLRTLLIRNGINPYFWGKLKYIDTIDLFKKISYLTSQFIPFDNDKQQISYSLQSIANNIYKENIIQEHSSSADIKLTIQCLKESVNRYNLELNKLITNTYLTDDRSIWEIFYVDYKNSNRDELKVYFKKIVVLDNSKLQYLIIDLEEYQNLKTKEKINSIRYLNLQTQIIYASIIESTNNCWEEVSKQALHEFSNIKISNFFTKTVCDIEQDIYRLNPNKIQFVDYSPNKILKKDFKFDLDYRQLIIRKYLRESNVRQTSKYQKYLKEYAKYRYEKGVILNKTNNKKSDISDNFNQMEKVLNELLDSNSAKNNQPLKNLKKYYQNSVLKKLI